MTPPPFQIIVLSVCSWHTDSSLYRHRTLQMLMNYSVFHDKMYLQRQVNFLTTYIKTAFDLLIQHVYSVCNGNLKRPCCRGIYKNSTQMLYVVQFCYLLFSSYLKIDNWRISYRTAIS